LASVVPGAAAQMLTPAHLATQLGAGVNTKTVPANLDPRLSRGGQTLSFAGINGCNLGHSEVKSKPCVYGDRNSRVSVVLFGDSHAAAWFPALDLISKEQHWRLAIFTKDGCPPAEVNIAARFRHGRSYWECTRWTNNAKAQIAALHPTLVIVATATYLEEPEARPEPGVPRRRGGAWQNGMAATFGFLHRVARHTIFISDGPTMREWVPSCVSRHLSDVRACTTSRSAALLLPKVRAKEIELARRAGVEVIDPTSWFCASGRCPVIVGHILLYRDNAHMTPAWSRFIAPVLANSIVPIVGRQA
jgi:hypothetical protein